MGVRINTNVEALNAQRNLSLSATAFGKSVEKLSSGLRINRASDDAAGLSISEKLRAQARHGRIHLGWPGRRIGRRNPPAAGHPDIGRTA